MKCVRSSAIVLWGLLAFPAWVLAAQVASDVDPMQRYVLFYNELGTTVYPVIQAPQASNCSTTTDNTLLRIYVNDGVKGAGVPSKGHVRVNIPKNQPCAKGGFYDSARILV